MGPYLKVLTRATIREVISLAGDYRRDAEAEDINTPDVQTAGDGIAEMMAKGPNQKLIALHQKVEALSDNEKNELMALMWLGRNAAGETPEMWSYLLDEARTQEEPGKTLYLTEKPLDRYLRDGLERLKLQ